MPKKIILVIEPDMTFIWKFEKALASQFLDKEFEVKQIMPHFIKGKSVMIEGCEAEVREYIDQTTVSMVLIDINISNKEKDNTGIELGLHLRSKFPALPIFPMTEKNKEESDFDTICDATLEDFDGVLVKEYLLSEQEFSAARFRKMITKAETKRNKLTNNIKEHFDLVIISVIPKEFEAQNRVFSFRKKNEPAHKSINGIRFWKKTIKQKKPKSKNINILFTMIGDAGNTLSAIVSDIIFKNFEIETAILCGIGASGNSENIKLYSTVIADSIVYYELQKFTKDHKIEYRLAANPLESFTHRDIPYILERKSYWKSEFEKNITGEIQEKDFEGKAWISNDWRDQISLTSGVIASGEKLLADGSTVQELNDVIKISKGVKAIEMEGYGFCKSCKENKIPRWLVFRGISDYGGAEKSDEIVDKYQIIAAISAATLAKDYVLNVYEPVEN